VNQKACPIPPADPPISGRFKISRLREDKVITSLAIAVIFVLVGSVLAQHNVKNTVIVSEGSNLLGFSQGEPEIEIKHYEFEDVDKDTEVHELAVQLGEILRNDPDVQELHITTDDVSTCAHVPEWYVLNSSDEVIVLLRYVRSAEPRTGGDRERYFDIVIDLLGESIVSIAEVPDDKPIQLSCVRVSHLING